MIAAIIIVGIALAWLGYETQWLTLRLSYRETIAEYDRRILAEMAANHKMWQELDAMTDDRVTPKSAYTNKRHGAELPLMPKVRRPGIQAGLL